jgi:hypothetical protein
MSNSNPNNRETDLNRVIQVLLDPEAEFEWDDAWDHLQSIESKDNIHAYILKDVIRSNYERNRGDFAQLFALKALRKMGVSRNDLYEDLLKLAKTGKEHLLRIESMKEIRASSKDREVRISDLCAVINTNSDNSIVLRMSFFLVLMRFVGGPFKALSVLSNNKKAGVKLSKK